MASNLNNARTNKNDEFYTRFDTINDEINTNEHGYRPFFKDQIVYCNCDDPEESNFWKFFKTVFKAYGIKKLISTHYTQDGSSSYKLEYNGERVVKTELEGDGDFRSPECVELLKESDIVVTNPPFSLFIPFVELLMQYNKKFVVIGNKNAIPLKNVFEFIKEGKIWTGYEIPKDFITPEGETTTRVNGLCRWFTNLEIPKRREPLLIGWRYEKGLEMGMYAKYENYDAINVNEVCDIPKDYFGLMGVPITFLDKFCPEQFEIIGCAEPATRLDVLKTQKKFKEYKSRQIYIDGVLCQKHYHRIFIRRR